MKFRNPFKKRMTAAEALQKMRAIAEKYNFTEAYYKYQDMKDVNTDRPEYIKVLYAFEPRLLTDPPKYGNRLEFTSEVIETFGKYIWLFATNVGTKQHIYAKEHYVPLFA